MNLKNWFNYCSFSNGSKESRIRVCTMVCIYSLPCSSSISKTIIHICHGVVVPSHRNSVDECRILINSCELDVVSQRLKVLHTFAQSVFVLDVI